jgi:TPR repeat protein
MPTIWWLLVLAMSGLAVCVSADTAPTGSQQQTAGSADLRARAEQGDAEAQFTLGRMYGKGDGIPQDGVQAVAWFRKAADQGHAKAQNGLGVMYASGQGVPQDWVQAVMWFRKAADQGEPMAQCNLGAMYEDGHGVPQDHAQAAAWYRKAAEHGYAEGQFNLSLMYVNGRGVPQDYAQALVWYRKAAEQGYAAAQHNLGRMYETGRGVPQDNVEAHRWQDLAAARATGEDQKKFAEGRDELARSMTPDQVAEARRRAQEWTDAFERRRTAQASQATQAQQAPQAKAALDQPALQLTDVTITPRVVGAGKPFSLDVAYIATDPAAASRRAAVTMSFSILSGGTSLLEVPAEKVESTSGQPWKITKPLTAAATPGTYLIRIRLALGATVVTRDVEFEITR